MKPFNRLTNKIKSTRGASITYALLIMLLGALVSAVVVASAYSASRAAAKDFDQQQEFLLVDSAVKLFKDQIESTGADTAGELRYKTTQVITYNGATEDTGVATTGALTESWPESDAANKKWITPLMVAAINALKTQDTFTHDKIEIDYTEIITKATFEMKKTANGIDYPITMTITTDSD
ncbi:MAG: hypothetical protein HUJ75_01220, partial [Parasporobacterium sp.]|nr:hypothetical protein [Parasporobacterium sp.]